MTRDKKKKGSNENFMCHDPMKMFGPSGTVLGSTSCPRACCHASYHRQRWICGSRSRTLTLILTQSPDEWVEVSWGGRTENASEVAVLQHAEGKVLMPSGRFKTPAALIESLLDLKCIEFRLVKPNPEVLPAMAPEL